MSDAAYVHGYSSRECVRLSDQAATLADLLHHDTIYAPGARVLECGCGTGAQTVILARNNPQTRIDSVDLAWHSVEHARRRVEIAGHRNVRFHLGDVYALPFRDETFDHVFVCFVLEHLPDPVRALRALGRVLRRGGSLTVIEGDHGSWYCHPHTPEAARTVECLIAVQAHMGGDARIGRRLYPLAAEAGFRQVRVSPRMVYVDSSRPDLVDGFSKKTFIAMVEGVGGQSQALGLIDKPAWDKGIADLYRATEPDGTFCYTFFKAVALK